MSPESTPSQHHRRPHGVMWRSLAGATAIATAVGISMLGAAPASAAGSAVPITDGATLTSAFSQASAGASVTATLSGDVTITGSAFTLAGGSLTIDLNEHELFVTAPAGQVALTVEAGASLRVEGGKVATFVGGSGTDGANASVPSGSFAGHGATGTATSPTGGAGPDGTVPGERGGEGGAGFPAIDAVGGNGGVGGDGGVGAIGGDGGSGGASTYSVAPTDPFAGATGGNGGNGGNGINGGDAMSGGAGIVISGVVTVSGSRLIGAGGMGGNGGNGSAGAAGGSGGFGADLNVTSGTPTNASRGGNGGVGGRGGNGGAAGNGGAGIDIQDGILLTGSAPGSNLAWYGGPSGAVSGAPGLGGIGGSGGVAGQTVLNGSIVSSPDPTYRGTAGADGADGAPGAGGNDADNLDDTANSLVGWEVAADGTTTAPSSGIAVLEANDGTESAWVLRDSRGLGGEISTLGAVSAALAHGNIAFPSYAGHTFLGWSSSPDGSSGLLLSSTKVEIGEIGVTPYYAQWEVTPAVTPSTSTPTTTPTAKSLASTGADVNGWLTLSILLGLGGAAAIVLDRRRARTRTDRN
ncbi:LPXTG cell wall anchor domain-containing protein [Parafrigoribacterium humi]|uniref:LPXTG cell wall anchor domain-containing protein n=1 Tax=Parafrigoribacterium humi TaxID=3144664 RepID=UPI0032ECE633